MLSPLKESRQIKEEGKRGRGKQEKGETGAMTGEKGWGVGGEGCGKKLSVTNQNFFICGQVKN
jgi:hypothetical protein